MGSVPNAIFERLLEAVAQGQSAQLMEQLSVLVNAGHSPSSLARQMSRYLRNTLMAKIGGEQTQLLQISADERARAARTAMLFTEEELTRNLQIVLRTFDDLNYRQEQRFHLELGLLKLIHAQRLLPIEELLSGASSGSSVRSTPAPAAPRTASPARPAPQATPAPKPAPSLSPFSTGGSPFSTDKWTPSGSGSSGSSMSAVSAPIAAQPPVAQPVPEPAAHPQAVPFPAASAPAMGYASTENMTEGALAIAPEPQAQPPAAAAVPSPAGPTAAVPPPAVPSIDTLRHAVGVALVEGGHASAAQLLGAAEWKLEGASLRIAVPGVGKKMLSLTVNAAAEKIIRNELQRLGAPSRFMVVPGEGTAASAAAAAAAPLAGSIQEEALAHPMVQRAKEIFNAEVRSVVDLRQK
jgi:DNA polymerase-3 subunit gamma/tau